MAELVYPPVIRLVKTFWKYLDLRFTFYGQSHIPAKGPAILAMNHIGYLDFAIAGTAVLLRSDSSHAACLESDSCGLLSRSKVD